jgi:hypothetical protein
LRKSGDGRFSPEPERTYPTTSGTGSPSALSRLTTTMRIWSSATCLSKSLANSDLLGNFTQCIFASTRLWRLYSLQRCQTVRPRYRCVLTGSLRAIVPSLVGFQGLAFLRGEITAWARVPHALTFGLDASAVVGRIQRPRRTAIRQAYVHCFLTST